MQTSLLATKLFIPVVRPTVVPRPHLIARLTAGVAGKLTLVSAPAGFGKTTLVSAWISTSKLAAAWVSLDKDDRDPDRFLSYLIAALQNVIPAFGDNLLGAFTTPQPIPPISMVTALINELAFHNGQVVLVLDDYHVLDANAIDELLAFLLDHLPPQLHLVIITREDPSFPLVRLRARGELTELRVADLRFAAPETAQFLNQHMNQDLGKDVISIVDQRIDGWIAGLQMAAISMRDCNDIYQFLRAFSGSHRYIVDYLMEEILSRLSDETRTFLLQTSILERLSAPLCNAVTGEDNADQVLAMLERANMFIFPLDDHREWYRYHHLFAEVLQTYALRDMGALVSDWYSRASTWHEQSGFRATAIDYAFAADDLQRAAALIEQTWPEMEFGVRPMQWLGWAEKLPHPMRVQRPVLSAAYAWMLLDKGELTSAQKCLHDVEHWLNLVDTTGREATAAAGMLVSNEVQFGSLAGSTAGARAYLAQAQGNIPDTIVYAERALTLLSKDDHFWRGNAALFLGLARWASGNLTAAYDAISESVDNQRLAESQFFEMLGIVVLGDIRAAQGHLQDAHQHYMQALHLAEPGNSLDTPITTGTSIAQAPIALYISLSELYCEWGDLETATAFLTTGEAMLERAVLPGSAYRVSSALATIKLAEGKLADALVALETADQRYQPSPIPDLRPIDAIRVQVWLRQDRLSDALNWVRNRGFSVHDELTMLNMYEYRTLARVYISAYQHNGEADVIEQVFILLTRLLQKAQAAAWTESIIGVLILFAITHDILDETEAALPYLENALTLAEPAGYMQAFAAERASIWTLLAACLTRNTNRAYVKQIMTFIDHPSVDPPTYVDPNQLLIEPLSKRERDVLRLIAQGYSNQQIADTLVIALSTVKKHINSIFGKLNVSNRTQAVKHANELDLL